MKPSVVYLNFALDEEWAEGALAPLKRVSSPLAAPLAVGLAELGLFFCGPGDWLVSGATPDEKFLEFLKQHGIFAERIHPDEIRNQAGQIAGREIVVSGLGREENALFYLSRRQVRSSEIEKQKTWNSKTFLFETARALGIPFPESVVIGIRPGHHSAELPAGRWLFKADHSAGGTGIVDGGGDPERMLETLARMIEKPGRWLAQRAYERSADFYTLGRVEEQVHIDAILDLKFDEKLSSYRHAPATMTSDLTPFREAARKLGEELMRQGYRGFFGVDGFKTTTGEVFPAVDLNVRLDKARAVFKAATVFGLPEGGWVSLRRRYYDFRPAGFGQFFREVRERLKLDERGRAGEDFCLPYLFTPAGQGAAEIQWFVSPRLEAASLEAMDFAAKSGKDKP